MAIVSTIPTIISGCRKNSEQVRAEAEAKERAGKEKELMSERTKSLAREKYLLGREKGKSRYYREAIDLLNEAEQLDVRIKLQTQLFRNSMADDMLKVAAEMMEDGIIDDAGKILEMLDSRKHFNKHLAKTAEGKRTLEWYRNGYAKFNKAQQSIASYRTAEAIAILKEIILEYEKTRLADKSAAILLTLGQ